MNIYTLMRRTSFGVQHILPRARYSVIGSYHYENVGDMMLGEVSRELLKKAVGSNKSDIPLQILANASKWKSARAALVCGGAVIDQTSINELKKYMKNGESKISIIGVELKNGAIIGDSEIDFLNQVSYLSLRNKTQVDYLNSLGVKSIHSHPDLAFAADGFNFKQDKAKPGKIPVLGMNIVSGCGKDKKRTKIEEQ